jgi:GT2 family glycosyltransferase
MEKQLSFIATTITTDTRKLSDFETSTTGIAANVSVYHNEPNCGVVPALQSVYRQQKGYDVIVFMHDDVLIYDHLSSSWYEQVMAEFCDPKVAIVGLGGASGIGLPDIYKIPYRTNQLQRIDYRSNQEDWEIHGGHGLGRRDVAVVDGFFMAVRTEFLNQIDGWAGFKHNFHMYDAYLCLMAARRGWKVRCVGVKCLHRGGGTSTKAEYAEWCKERGTTMERDHQEPHVFIYEEFRDLLPLRVGGEVL